MSRMLGRAEFAAQAPEMFSDRYSRHRRSAAGRTACRRRTGRGRRVFQRCHAPRLELVEVPPGLGHADHRRVQAAAPDHRLKGGENFLVGQVAGRAQKTPGRRNALRPSASPSRSGRMVLYGPRLRRTLPAWRLWRRFVRTGSAVGYIMRMSSGPPSFRQEPTLCRSTAAVCSPSWACWSPSWAFAPATPRPWSRTTLHLFDEADARSSGPPATPGGRREVRPGFPPQDGREAARGRPETTPRDKGTSSEG